MFFITLLAIFTTLVISLIGTPIARRLAIRFKLYDSPNHRTVHNGSTPKLGGLSIYFAFTAGLIIYTLFTNEARLLAGLLIGGSLVLIVGLFDDIHNLSCYRKLIGQTLAAVIAVWFGFTVEAVYLPSGVSLQLGFLAAPISVLWIVSVTNALNLLDGLDGLASGFTIVAAFFILLGAVIFKNFEIAVTALILIAAALGFLRYNFAPAKIFMGDMGSLFLGYALACISLKAFTTPEGGSHAAVLIILFLVPLADTFLSIWRRVSQGRHPFSPDKKHIHHRLLSLGFSQTAAVVIIYAATFLCGVTGLVLFVADIKIALLLLGALLLFFLFGLIQLGCFDFLSGKEYSEEPG